MKKIVFLFLLFSTWRASAAGEFVLSSSDALRHFRLGMREGASLTRIEIRKGSEKPFITLDLTPDKDGRSLGIRSARISETEKIPLDRRHLIFWPGEKDIKSLAGLKEAGISEQSWRGRTLPGTIRFDSWGVRIWLEGRLILNQPLDADGGFSLEVVPGKETDFAWEEGKWPTGLFEPLPMAHLTGASAKGRAALVEKSGVPFEVWDEGRAALPLAKAGWPEWRADLFHFIERQDGSSRLYLMDDGRIPFAQIPKADYVAAYVLASAEEEPGATNALTLRAGRRNGDTARADAQLLLHDFAARVPYGSSPQVVRVPLNNAFSQNVESDILDIELTKELRLSRRSPDPNRFRWRPLGPPSNVRIVAVTLEKSPIQMQAHPTQSGALFEQPEKVAYRVTLTNITAESRDVTIALTSGETAREVSVRVPAGETVEKEVTLDGEKPGWHPLRIALKDKQSGPLFAYETAFGVLPPDTRKHREEAPWGAWDFGGAHFTPTDADQVGSVMRKLGLRYGMFTASAEERQRYGVIKGNETKVTATTKEPEKAAEAYREMKKKHPDLLPDYLIFHENAISGGHAVRVPDLFHDHPPYQLNEAEEKEFRRMWDIAATAAKAMRKEFPEVQLIFGNGNHPLKEEFYRRQFPTELFDAGGNEAAGFGRPPESQPPDGVAVNAGLWMDRQLLDAYGYKDKPVAQCCEVIYPATNPGNLSLQTQADYFMRHILHAMAWKIPKIRPGSTADMGNSYYNSNWGATGFLTSRPEWAPKPAAVALATLTRVLDGMEYQGFLETGSDSVYLLHFARKDGAQVFPFWTVRGQRELRLNVKGAAAAKVIAQDGNTTEIAAKDGLLMVTATASPAWLELPAGASLSCAQLGEPKYPDSEPRGKVSRLSPLDSLDGWKIAEEPNPLLDYYNPMTPRRKGDFSIAPEGGALKVVARPLKTGKPTMPMYAELISEKKMELPGKPAEIGLWVDGNSGWGRIIFELEDASGQRWTSIGARSKGGSDWMKDWLGEKGNTEYQPGETADWNTDDLFGFSRVNFDGWRYVGVPLPGQYPGEGYHWPANGQWRSDKDGIAHYPLILKKVIVELPERTLYLTRFEPPKRPEISLRNLVSVERDDINAPKSSPGDYVEEAQVSMK